MVPTVEQVNERRIRFEAPTAYDMIRWFKAVCTLISVATEQTYG
jgi:D-amino peptidase